MAKGKTTADKPKETTAPAEQAVPEEVQEQVSGLGQDDKSKIEALEAERDSLLEDNEALKGALEGANEVILNQQKHISDLESKLEIKQDASKEALPTKSVVVAVKNGVEREFPLMAWNNMPKDKGGWKQKVETPKEAQ